MKRIFSILTATTLAIALTACGSSGSSTADTTAADTAAEDTAAADTAESDAEADVDASEAEGNQDVTVRIGLTGTFNEDIWAPAAAELEKEGIHLEYVQFSNYTLPNDALNNGDIEMNAFQHHAYLENEIESYGYDITAIGDTYVVAMNIYSDKINDLSELKEGDKIAIPNDATNKGRALKLLEAAGIIEIDPAAGASPDTPDITGYKVPIEFVEVGANLVCSTLPDVTLAVINGNYALDNGLTADEALFKESNYEDNSYFGLIAVRTEDAENPVYKRIVEAYQSQQTIDVFNNEFAGFFLPAWELDVE